MESSEKEIHPNILKALSISFGKDDLAAIRKFLEESQCEIDDVYRGICPQTNGKTTTNNIWRGCVDEISCVTQKERKLDEDYRLEQSLKKKRRKNSGRRRKIEICKCNYNPQCLLSLGGSMNAVLTRKRKLQQDSCIIIDSQSPILDTISICSNTSESKNNGILSHVRKSIKVARKEIEKFFVSLDLSRHCSFSAYIDQIEKYHSSLLLPSTDDNNDPETIQLSLPPGMINLGATCYLNSQIQCLTQNIAFQRGVLSWRNKNVKSSNTLSHQSLSSESGINAALYHLQDLLANLQHTPNDTIDTTNFASSLNLLESEMQDPNEFSRLLLDRMMDLCPELKDLLKNIFEGVISYETKCKCCKNIRSRRETFMELTLPIPENTQSASSKKKSKSKYNNIFSIKECLKEYLKIENLHSENQYYCETCNTKRDAHRKVSFMSLPPILQIQLSRYVFDVQRNVKRKRMDEAKLPEILNIESDGNIKEYILCGVLHHMGTSAYGGHYIAEGMDWTTGIWFEFNDKDVRILEKGPTGKEEKKIVVDNDATNGGKKRLKGSSDAYSMFYVERKFLRREVKQEVKRRASNELKNDAIIENVMHEREKEYQKILKAQGECLLHQSKMNRRHDRVLTDLFSEETPLHLDPSHRNLKWVDGFLLRNFLSCPNYRLQEYQKDASRKECMFSYKESLCSHNIGLHPRIARRGKLITEQMYNTIISILEEEGHNRSKESDNDSCPSSDIFCQHCVSSYTTEIRDKFHILMTLMEIFSEVEALPNAANAKEMISQELYVVSSRFLTDLKRYSIKKLKEIIKDKFIQEEGIDRLNFNEIIKSKGILEAGGDPLMDPYVNTRITCHHNKLKQVNSRAARILPQYIWDKIIKLFPLAIKHTCKVPLHGDKINTFLNQIHCEDCDREQKESENLHEWAQQCLREKSLKCLIKGKARDPIRSFQSNSTVYFVRNVLWDSWKGAVDYYAGKSKVKDEIELEIFSIYEQVYSQENGKEGGMIQKDTVQQSKGFLHICSLHNLTLPIPSHTLQEVSAMIPQTSFEHLWKNKKKFSLQATNNMKVMTEREYETFSKSFTTFPHSAVKKINGQSLAVKLKVAELEYSFHPLICSQCLKSFSGDAENKLNIDDSFLIKEQSSSKQEIAYTKNLKNETLSNKPCLEISLQVHEINGNDCVFTAAKAEVSLVSASAFSNQKNAHVNEWSDGNVVRRSTRKRKARFQSSLSINMKKTDTLAKLRLLLYERYNKSPLNQRLFLTVFFKNEKDMETNSATEYIVHELPNELNEKCFESILKEKADKRVKKLAQNDPTNTESHPDYKFWLYLQYSENKANKMTKREQNEIEDSLVNSLLMINEPFAETNVEKKSGKRRGTERGFHGTFLQSTVISSDFQNKSAEKKSVPSIVRNEIIKKAFPNHRATSDSTDFVSKLDNGTEMKPITID